MLKYVYFQEYMEEKSKNAKEGLEPCSAKFNVALWILKE